MVEPVPETSRKHLTPPNVIQGQTAPATIMEPRQSYNRVFELLETHQKWFANSLPLIASENIPSPAVREALLSDFGNRYAEGWTGERVYPAASTSTRSNRSASTSQNNSST